LKPENILNKPNIGTEEGTQKWADEIRPRLGKLAEGKIGVDIWTKVTDHIAGDMMETIKSDSIKLKDGKTVWARAHVTAHCAATRRSASLRSVMS
jgi:hypothetical protein